MVLRNIEKQLDRYITAMALHSGALRGEINTANETNCPGDAEGNESGNCLRGNIALSLK